MKKSRRNSTFGTPKQSRKKYRKKFLNKSRQDPKHHRELMKRLRRTGQYIFGEEDK